MAVLILLLMAQDVVAGPIRIESQAPLQNLRSGLLPRCMAPLRRGERKFRLSTIWVNHWAYDNDHYRVDYEKVDAHASVAWGITDAWAVELGLSQTTLFGGRLDGLIQEFHDALGIPQNGRDDFPHGDLEDRPAFGGGPSPSFHQ